MEITDEECIMNKDTIYNCNNIPILVFDNPKNTSVRGIRDLESGVFFPLPYNSPQLFFCCPTCYINNCEKY